MTTRVGKEVLSRFSDQALTLIGDDPVAFTGCGFEPDSEGKPHRAQQKVNGGPSVLYDAVAVLLSADGAKLLAAEVAAKDFVSDAFAHAKFIAYVETAMPLLNKAGITVDDGVIPLKIAKSATGRGR